MKDLIVGFKIGRGGRFNNSGYKTFLGECKISDFTNDLFVRFENEGKILKEIGNRQNLIYKFYECRSSENFDFFEKLGFDLGQKIFVDGNDNEVGLSYEDYLSGIGIIDIDGAYDTVYTRLLSDLKESDIDLVNASDFWNSLQMIEFLESAQTN